jgi:MFS family permease
VLCLVVLKRIYGAEAVGKHDYSTTLSSLAFAGTVVGMLVFGYVSDRIGRKTGMVRSLMLQRDFLDADLSLQW